jgi:hypothetical protein
MVSKKDVKTDMYAPVFSRQKPVGKAPTPSKAAGPKAPNRTPKPVKRGYGR